MIAILAFCTFLFAGYASPKTASETHSIKVTVVNLRNLSGELEVALYNDQAKFPKVGETYKMVRLKVTGFMMSYEFKDLKPGNYAVCVFHDENANKVCDKNLLGIPVEGYAFSNNIKPKLSAPKFKDCAVYLNDDKAFAMKMIY
jgi:uncharacterized protein (DUF2141 family)